MFLSSTLLVTFTLNEHACALMLQLFEAKRKSFFRTWESLGMRLPKQIIGLAELNLSLGFGGFVQTLQAWI